MDSAQAEEIKQRARVYTQACAQVVALKKKLEGSLHARFDAGVSLFREVYAVMHPIGFFQGQTGGAKRKVGRRYYTQETFYEERVLPTMGQDEASLSHVSYRTARRWITIVKWLQAHPQDHEMLRNKGVNESVKYISSGGPHDVDDDEPSTTTSTAPVSFKAPCGQTVLHKDVERIDGQGWLNDTIIDVGLRDCSGLDPAITVASEGHFYDKFTEDTEEDSDSVEDDMEGAVDKRHEKVAKWTKGVDIFTKKFAFIPVNGGNHWSLVLLVNLDQLPSGGTCSVVHMDSLSMHPSEKIYENIRSYLQCELEAKGYDVEFSPSSTRLVVTRVPQQANGFDCGVFVLMFAERVMQRASDWVGMKGVDNLIDFTPEDVVAKRVSLRASFDEFSKAAATPSSAGPETTGQTGSKSPAKGQSGSAPPPPATEQTRSKSPVAAKGKETNWDDPSPIIIRAPLASRRKAAHMSSLKDDASRSPPPKTHVAPDQSPPPKMKTEPKRHKTAEEAKDAAREEWLLKETAAPAALVSLKGSPPPQTRSKTPTAPKRSPPALVTPATQERRVATRSADTERPKSSPPPTRSKTPLPPPKERRKSLATPATEERHPKADRSSAAPKRPTSPSTTASQSARSQAQSKAPDHPTPANQSTRVTRPAKKARSELRSQAAGKTRDEEDMEIDIDKAQDEGTGRAQGKAQEEEQGKAQAQSKAQEEEEGETQGEGGMEIDKAQAQGKDQEEEQGKAQAQSKAQEEEEGMEIDKAQAQGEGQEEEEGKAQAQGKGKAREEEEGETRGEGGMEIEKAQGKAQEEEQGKAQEEEEGMEIDNAQEEEEGMEIGKAQAQSKAQEEEEGETQGEGGMEIDKAQGKARGEERQVTAIAREKFCPYMNEVLDDDLRNIMPLHRETLLQNAFAALVQRPDVIQLLHDAAVDKEAEAFPYGRVLPNTRAQYVCAANSALTMLYSVPELRNKWSSQDCHDTKCLGMQVASAFQHIASGHKVSRAVHNALARLGGTFKTGEFHDLEEWYREFRDRVKTLGDCCGGRRDDIGGALKVGTSSFLEGCRCVDPAVESDTSFRVFTAHTPQGGATVGQLIHASLGGGAHSHPFPPNPECEGHGGVRRTFFSSVSGHMMVQIIRQGVADDEGGVVVVQDGHVDLPDMEVVDMSNVISSGVRELHLQKAAVAYFTGNHYIVQVQWNGHPFIMDDLDPDGPRPRFGGLTEEEKMSCVPVMVLYSTRGTVAY